MCWWVIHKVTQANFFPSLRELTFLKFFRFSLFWLAYSAEFWRFLITLVYLSNIYNRDLPSEAFMNWFSPENWHWRHDFHLRSLLIKFTSNYEHDKQRCASVESWMWGFGPSVETMTTTKFNTCTCGTTIWICTPSTINFMSNNQQRRIRIDYEASNRRKAIYNNVEAHIKRFSDGLVVLSGSQVSM